MERNKREIGLLPYVSLGQGAEVGQGSGRRKERVWHGWGYKLEVTLKTRTNVFILFHLHHYRVIFKAFISS